MTYSELQAAGASGKTEMATILVVEDEFGIAEVLESVLVDAGHDVVTAINGKQGLARLAEKPPQLVLLDFMMPLLDGFEVCQQLKGNDETRLIPIVIMTALGQVEDRIKGIEAGADDFLTKPFNRDELLAERTC